MPAISVRSVSKSFGPQNVLKDISFDIGHGEKVGLVGQNGSGKSTLLNMIYGLEKQDMGEIIIPRDLSMGYMTQESDLDDSKTLLEAVCVPTGHLGSLTKKIAYIEKKLEDPGTLPQEEVDEISRDYASALEEFAASGGYGHTSKAESVLEALDLTKKHFNTRVENLSGGERTKARLARIILEAEGTDILLMDEPTNHLDIESTEWLEDYLKKFKGAILTVSHDRYLLDALVTKIVELEGSRSKTYSGNFSTFTEKKAQEFERQQTMYKKQQKEIKRMEEMVEFMHRVYHYNSIHKTKQKMLDRMDKMDRPDDRTQRLKLDFGAAEKSGKDTVDGNGLSKRFGDNLVIGKCDFRIEKGEKVGLIGPNGSGKTTLVNLITGKEPPSSGTVRISKGVTMGCYTQEQDGLVRSNTVIQEIRKERKDAPEEWVRRFLGRFFFKGDDVFKKVFVLSGGERARLAIAKLLLSSHNLLILDEPTNYLDLYARSAVEAALTDYEGTMLIISHDRALLDNVVTSIFELQGGALTVYAGNYSDYRRVKGRQGMSQDGDAYEVTRKFTDWATGKKFRQGERLRIKAGELDKYRWAVENGFLVKK